MGIVGGESGFPEIGLPETQHGFLVRCTVSRLSMKFIFDFFYTSFDRGIRADHEYVFSVFFENLFRVEKFKINESGQKPKK